MFMFAAITLWFASSLIEYIINGNITSLMSVASAILFTIAIITEKKHEQSNRDTNESDRLTKRSF